MLNTSVINTFQRKCFMLLAVAVMMVSTTIAREKDTANGDENAAVACLRVEDGQVYFSVKFDNAAGGKFDVLVNDINGDNLYRGTFSETNFKKVFKAPSESGKLVVIIRNSKDKTLHKFEITSEARYVQQAIVKRM